MFSKACEYGIRASIFLTGQSLSGKRMSLKDVAKAIDSPEAYTSKILQQLSKSNIIVSEKGPNGGFSINKQGQENLKLSHIVSAIDGNGIFEACGLGLKKCNANKPCSVHDKFKGIRDDLKNMLETTTLQSLAVNLNNGLAFLKR